MPADKGELELSPELPHPAAPVTDPPDGPLVLEAGRAAVGRARALVRQHLADADPDLVSDAELVVSELVTNAQLHAHGPVTVSVTVTREGVRLEVTDASAVPPLAVRSGSGAMTGRGLALVEALGVWGVTPRSGGKTVWAELGPGVVAQRSGPLPDAFDPLAAWDDDPEPRYQVRLGSVPTALLITAKEHVDNLVRELTLAGEGGPNTPEPLRALVASVVHGFADARSAIKRQAVQAGLAGRAETELVLHLPARAAEAGDAYLAALDELDRYARAARLLTLESRPSHRAFRHWYVSALIAQLRAQVAGQPIPVTPQFPEVLASELDSLSGVRVAARTAGSLFEVGAALARAVDPREAARCVVSEGARALGAYAGDLTVRENDQLLSLASEGYGQSALDRSASADLEEPLPGSLALRTNRAVWIDSPETLALEHPALTDYLAAHEPETAALCAVPLPSTQGGVLRFSFRTRQMFDEDERRFVLALADQAAVALDRSGLYAAERSARREAEGLARRLDLLTTVTSALTGAGNTEDIVEIVTTMATSNLGAMTARVYLMDERRMLCSAGHVGGDATLADQYHEFPADDPLPGGEALRTGGPVVLADLAELAERFPVLAGVYPSERTLLVAPLTIGDRQLGVLSLTFEGTADVQQSTQVAFIATLADATAQAIERARSAERAVVANARLAFLAEASLLLAESLDVDEVLQTMADLVVPRLADWCVIHLVRDGELVTAALAHSDPDRVSWARETEVRYPPSMSGTTGVPHVIATGTSELYPDISDELLQQGAVDDEHLQLLRMIGMSSVLLAPLRGRSGTFGAITLVHADSGRRFTESDRDLVEELARRAAQCVETATSFAEQQGRLAAVTRVAEVAQRAILADPPSRVGNLRLEARYVSAAAEAKIGGDLYEVVPRADGVRVIVGDVRGKGLDAVRTATLVLGEFRAAAQVESVAEAAAQVDARLRPFFTDEDFVTAVLIDISDDGSYRLVSCGHPAPLICGPRGVHELAVIAAAPLGLGSEWEMTTGTLAPGERLFAFTDGLSEARKPDGEFVEPAAVAAPLCGAPLARSLDKVLQDLRAASATQLADDLALLVVEHDPI
ncbi:MAG: hypothetical protein QOJ92_1618 [Frankiales bacterium]|nr:hypothetical protein [Frankiales bacterium]